MSSLVNWVASNLVYFNLFPDVWIIGDSLVSHAGEEAIGKGQKNLQLAGKTVRWFGLSGMHWTQFQNTVQNKMLFHPTPEMIVIHLGGNDLVTVRQASLIRRITKRLKHLQSVFPDAFIVWSDILPRKKWKGLKAQTKTALEAMDKKRKRINRAGRQAVRAFSLGRVISHEIDTETDGLIKSDGTHLTKIGNAIFILTLQEALRLFFNNPEKLIYDANDATH